jgi:hypothetical protein
LCIFSIEEGRIAVECASTFLVEEIIGLVGVWPSGGRAKIASPIAFPILSDSSEKEII